VTVTECACREAATDVWWVLAAAAPGAAASIAAVTVDAPSAAQVDNTELRRLPMDDESFMQIHRRVRSANKQFQACYLAIEQALQRARCAFSMDRAIA
jgi:hypothetical protein